MFKKLRQLARLQLAGKAMVCQAVITAKVVFFFPFSFFQKAMFEEHIYHFHKNNQTTSAHPVHWTDVLFRLIHVFLLFLAS